MGAATQRVATESEAVPEPGTRAFEPADVLRQVVIQGLTVSPDGESVVYVLRTVSGNRYVRSLWRVGFAGGRPRPLATGQVNNMRPRFSPDGKSLLFISDRSGTAQVWQMPLAGGEPQQLTAMPGPVQAAEWSPDGERVLFLAPSGEQRFIVGAPEDPVARQIRDYTWRLNGWGIRDEFMCAWTVSAGAGAPFRVTDARYDAGPAVWSADGDQILFVADLDEQDALIPCKQLWSLSARPGGEAPAQVACLPGGIYTVAGTPSARPAYLGNSRPGSPGWANSDLYVSDGGTGLRLAEGHDLDLCVRTYGDFTDDHQVFQPQLCWLDAERIVALVSRRGASHPYCFGLDGSAVPLAEGDFVCNALAVGGGNVVVAASDEGPADVCAVEGGGLRRLCRDGSSWFGPFRRRVERVEVPHPDGHSIDGWLLRASGRGAPGPLVIDVHGGPHLSFGPTPFLGMTALADAGSHAMWSNPRGSGGYGEAHARAASRWGEEEAADVLRVTEWAVEQGIADPGRIGLTGLSQGGYMTIWLLGRKPGVFAAAVSENPITDLLAQYGSGDNGIHVAQRAIGTVEPPWDQMDAFLDRSPFTEIHRNTAPLLLLHAEQDLRVPIGQSELVYTILRSLGREVELVRYPSESHVMVMVGRPDRRVDRIERMTAWFERHL
jgi:dipeptidyl aminopeptidase/acylaminoacyl peptidase